MELVVAFPLHRGLSERASMLHYTYFVLWIFLLTEFFCHRSVILGESNNKSSSALFFFLASCTVAKYPLKFQQEIVAATKTTFLLSPFTVIVSGMLQSLRDV
jgi:hypothetical protein